MPDVDSKQKRAQSKETRAVIDRLEDNEMAVILLGEDQETQVDLPVLLLPDGASDGAHLRITITLDEASRVAAEDRVKSLQDRLEKLSGKQGKKDFKL